MNAHLYDFHDIKFDQNSIMSRNMNIFFYYILAVWTSVDDRCTISKSWTVLVHLFAHGSLILFIQHHIDRLLLTRIVHIVSRNTILKTNKVCIRALEETSSKKFFWKICIGLWFLHKCTLKKLNKINIIY